VPRARFWFYPHARGLPTVRDLTAALDSSRIILRVRSRYIPRGREFRINWGNSSTPFPVSLNQPGAVANAVSKTRSFQLFQEAGVPSPAWTYDRDVAIQWLKDGHILGRDLDSGSQGRGITVYRKGTEPDAVGRHPFYVKYFRKEREFRVHVFAGEVIFHQEKLKRNGVDNADKYVRAHDRGWCFAFNHFGAKPVPAGVDGPAVDAVRALRLDFGAVDLGWNAGAGGTVFEVNTAPGLENSSLAAYVKAFNAL
jgi:hypothetical protein